jgi:hypothetical protein
LLPYALFAILVLVFLWRPIFTGRALLPGDYLAQMAPWSSVAKAPNPLPQWNPLQWDAIAQFYPWRVFYARSMLAGHIPLWNPHQFCGTPFLANGQSACLYPPNLVFLIFGPITAFTILAALHLFLAQMFMYWLMRELGVKELGGIVAAIVFAFSAFMVLWLELPTFVSVAVWLPLALMLVQRAVTRRSLFYGMLSGAALGTAFLAGHFQIAFYVVLATGLWWLWKTVETLRAEGKIYSFLKVGVPLIGCVVIAGLVAAPQVLPTLELAANSHRAGGPTAAGYDWFIANAAKPYRFVTAFAPRFFGDPSEGTYFLLGRLGRHAGSAADYMEYGMYAGVLPLLLAFVALGGVFKRKHVGFFAALAVLALLIAFGTPINYLFYHFVPGFSSLGGPNRILLLYLFGIAGLAGFGMDRFVEHASDRIRLGRRERPAGLVWGLIALHLVILCSVTSRVVASHFLRDLQMEPIRTLLFPVLLIVSDVVLLIRSFNVVSRSVFSVLAVAVLIADLFAFGINYNPTCERSEVYPKTKLTTELQRLTKNGERIAPINPNWSLFETPKNAILPPNAAMVYGLYDVQGYDSLYTREYKDESSRIQGTDSSPIENGNMVLVKRCTHDLDLYAGYAVSSTSACDDGTGRSKQVATQGGVHISKLLGAAPFANSYRLWGVDRVVRASKPAKAQYVSANRILVRNTLISATDVGIASFSYPGWAAIVHGHSTNVDFTYPYLGVAAANPREVLFVFEPFTFRLGLFLMLVGISALFTVGVYRAMRYNDRQFPDSSRERSAY